MANEFGAGFAHDSFLLAYRIPSVMRELFAEGAFLAAFVPTFTGVLSKDGRKAASSMANVILTASLIVVTVLCVAGMIGAPAIVRVMAPGFAAVPGKQELAVLLTRIMFPFLLLISLAAQATGMLNSSGRFATAALSSALFNVGAIALGLVLGRWMGPHIGMSEIAGMACGVVLGAALQLAAQLPALHRLGFRFRLSFDWSHPAFRKIVRLMAPALLASAALQINMVINTNFASQISDPLRGAHGAVSWLGYAMRLVQFPLGMFGVAFASAMLPSISRSAALMNFEEFRRTLSRSLSVVLLLTIPSSLGLIVLSRPIVGAIYESGEFRPYDTEQTALALGCYAIGLCAYASARILNHAFYALGDARTPMYVSLFSIVLNFGLPLLLVRQLHAGFAGLALTTSFAVAAECICLFVLLGRKVGGIDTRYLADRCARVLSASLVMAFPVWLLHTQIFDRFPPGRIAYFEELAFCVPVGLLLFAIGCRALGINEVRVGTNAVKAPLLKGWVAAYGWIRG